MPQIVAIRKLNPLPGRNELQADGNDWGSHLHLQGRLDPRGDTVAVEARLGQQILARLAPQSSSDLTRFEGLVPLMDASADQRITIVVLSGSRETPWLSIDYRLNRLPRSCQRRMKPLVLSSLSRSGTTAVMDALARHPSISVRGGYPFECHFARDEVMQLMRRRQTAARLFQINDQPGSRTATAATELSASIQDLIDHSQERIDEFYGIPEPIGATPTFYAEKWFTHPAVRMVRDLDPDYRELILLRDPRDVLASMVAFDQKRGYGGFGIQTFPSLQDFVRAFAGSVSDLARRLKSRRPNAVIVRYEQWVQSPKQTLTHAMQELEFAVPNDWLKAALATRPQAAATHMTSDQPKASVGRWRRDLDQDVIDACHNHLADSMAVLGYEL